MKIKITLNRQKWLGDDAGCLYKTVTVTESTANYVIDNGRKIIPSGTLIVTPKVSGLLVNDCDVTDGERVAQILVRGGYIDSKLPTSVEGSKTLLSNQGLFAVKYAETVIPSGDNGGGNAGGGSGVSGDLTPFRVGQTIKGVTIDPNAKTDEEIIEWLNTFSYTPNESIVLMAGRRAGYSNIVEVSENNGVKSLVFFADAENFLFFFSEDVPDMNVSKGWCRVVGSEANKPIPITEKTTFDSNYEIATIADEFAFLNGTVLGAVEGEAPTETLTPFRVGQRINGVTIDPTAKTDEEIVNWLNNLTNEQHLVELNNPNGIAVSEVGGVKTLTMFLNPISVNFAVDNISTGTSIPKGWSYMTQASGGTGITPITERTTLNFDTLEVTQVYSEFDFLNGVAVGVLEATNVPDVPQETLTPFSKGQNISAIKVNTNARTNDELSTFAAKALEGQGDSKILVSDSVGTKIVGVQGSANSGYIITAASDTNNNILWVSKGLDLDGKFTFPSAGWYLVNKNDSTFSETSGIVELPFTGTVTIGENIDAAFNSELNGIVFGVVAA